MAVTRFATKFFSCTDMSLIDKFRGKIVRVWISGETSLDGFPALQKVEVSVIGDVNLSIPPTVKIMNVTGPGRVILSSEEMYSQITRIRMPDCIGVDEFLKFTNATTVKFNCGNLVGFERLATLPLTRIHLIGRVPAGFSSVFPGITMFAFDTVPDEGNVFRSVKSLECIPRDFMRNRAMFPNATKVHSTKYFRSVADPAIETVPKKGKVIVNDGRIVFRTLRNAFHHSWMFRNESVIEFVGLLFYSRILEGMRNLRALILTECGLVDNLIVPWTVRMFAATCCSFLNGSKVNLLQCQLEQLVISHWNKVTDHFSFLQDRYANTERLLMLLANSTTVIPHIPFPVQLLDVDIDHLTELPLHLNAMRDAGAAIELRETNPDLSLFPARLNVPIGFRTAFYLGRRTAADIEVALEIVEAMQLMRMRRFGNPARETRGDITMFESRQSVHSRGIETSAMAHADKLIEEMGENVVDVFGFLESHSLSHLTTEVLIASKTEKYHSLIRAVVFRILQSEQVDDLAKRLGEEITEGIGECSLGKRNRLINTFNGFFDDMVLTITPAEDIGNIIVLTLRKLGQCSRETKQRVVRTALLQRGYTEDVIAPWLDSI